MIDPEDNPDETPLGGFDCLLVFLAIAAAILVLGGLVVWLLA